MEKAAVWYHDYSKQKVIEKALYRKINSVVHWSESVMLYDFAIKSMIEECHHFQTAPPNGLLHSIQLEYTDEHDENATGYLGNKISWQQVIYQPEQAKQAMSHKLK